MEGEDSVLSQFLHALADELTRLDYQARKMIDEKNTLTTDELLTDHERDFNIPGDCDVVMDTIEDRRTLINTRLKQMGDQDKNYFIGLAEDFEHTILIFEHHEDACICGEAECEDLCNDRIMSYYWSVAVYFSWSMDLVVNNEIRFLSNLICMFKKYRPAHTFVLWDYYGPAFSNGFSKGFDSKPPEALESTFEGGFENESFSLGFDKYNGEVFPAYRRGGFSKGFGLTSFDIFQGIDLSSYFIGGFTRGFSSGFNINKNV